MRPLPLHSLALGVFLGLVFNPGTLHAQEPSPTTADSTKGTLLQQLQEKDRQFYTDELYQVDPVLRDSALSTLSDLGIQEYLRESRSHRPLIDFSLDPAGGLIAYNRVEAVVAGLRAHFGFRNGTSLEAAAAYATAPRQLRHREVLRIPRRLLGRRTEFEFGFADRVVSYGSNHPAGNGLRALLGSADEQDYLRRRGGWASARVQLSPQRSLRLGYRGSRETSVSGRNDFGLFGDSRLLLFNAPILEGYDRGVFFGLTLGSLSETRTALSAHHEISGGALGGDFTYTRTHIHLSTRRYVPGNHELVLDAGLVETGGSPPVQQGADIGGLSTVRGFDRRSRVGRRSLSLRAEVLLPYNLLGFTPLRSLRIQGVPWADAGRTWEGVSKVWITSAGVGIQRFLGPFGSGAFLRLDAAIPLGPDRPEDLRLYLRFSRGLF